MRRILATVLVLAVAAVAVAAGGSGEARTYRVDAIFDNASSLIPGNVVKIAGAPVGEVKDIRLTRDRRARVEMEIEEGYAPFRSDAQCVIAPESLFIGEKFLQCKPGTPKGRPLGGRDGGAPTVPLESNSSTVDLDLVLSTLRLPVRERLTILFNELGAGLAGRPDDLAAAVERANPALKATNRVLRILDGDRATLRSLVDRSDQVLAELGSRSREVERFVDTAGQVASTTGGRAAELEETIRRLPPLLAELEPAAQRLSALTESATPAVRTLRQAAPDVAALLRDVAPLSTAGRPAVRALDRSARIGRRAIRPARPVARRLARVGELLPPVVGTTAGLVQSLQDSGGIEGLQSFIYNTVLTISRFDSVSHMQPAYLIFNSCSLPATEPAPACDAHYGTPPAAPHSAPRLLDGRALKRGLRAAAARPPPKKAAPASAGTPAPARAPAASRSRQQVEQALGPVLDWLLGP